MTREIDKEVGLVVFCDKKVLLQNFKGSKRVYSITAQGEYLSDVPVGEEIRYRSSACELFKTKLGIDTELEQWLFCFPYHETHDKEGCACFDETYLFSCKIDGDLIPSRVEEVNIANEGESLMRYKLYTMEEIKKLLDEQEIDKSLCTYILSTMVSFNVIEDHKKNPPAVSFSPYRRVGVYNQESNTIILDNMPDPHLKDGATLYVKESWSE